MKKSLVYTKTGDKGTTSLVGGSRVPKTHIRLEAYGTIDELNSHLGWLNTYLLDEADRDFILSIQHKLFSIGSHLATDQEKTQLKAASILTSEDVERIEREIDKLDEQLPELCAFIIPGGSRGAAICHVCRTICRRAERRILTLSETCTISPEVCGSHDPVISQLFDMDNQYVWWNMHEAKSRIEKLKAEQPNAPAFVCELQGGWFSTVGGRLSEDSYLDGRHARGIVWWWKEKVLK